MVQSFPWNGRRHYGTGPPSHEPGQILMHRMKTPAICHRDRGNPPGNTTSEARLKSLWAHDDSDEGPRTIRKIVFPTTQKTVAKWRKQASFADLPELKDAKSTGVDPRSGSDHRRVPSANTADAGRLPLFIAGVDPILQPIIPAALSAASRHQPHIVADQLPGRRRDWRIQNSGQHNRQNQKCLRQSCFTCARRKTDAMMYAGLDVKSCLRYTVRHDRGTCARPKEARQKPTRPTPRRPLESRAQGQYGPAQGASQGQGTGGARGGAGQR